MSAVKGAKVRFASRVGLPNYSWIEAGVEVDVEIDPDDEVPAETQIATALLMCKDVCKATLKARVPVATVEVAEGTGSTERKRGKSQAALAAEAAAIKAPDDNPFE